MRFTPFIIVVFLILCGSCSSSTDPLIVDRWQLDSTFSYMTNTGGPASELEYSQQLEFVADGLFLKSRVSDSDTTIIKGQWKEATVNDKPGFLVTYTQSSPLYFNCTNALQEFFFLRDGLLIQNDGIPCDGPEYRYKKISE